MKDLEQFQTKTLKSLLQCPRNVSPAIVRLLTGVEPIACRIDMLKLRYYWKITHAPASTKDTNSYRRKRIFSFNVGFTMEIFNLCCKIGKISFWHGTHRGNESHGRNANPLNAIKRAVTAYHLDKDLSTARSKDNLFTPLYLQNNTTYKNRYFLAKPFTSSGIFYNSSSRLKFIKALLSTNRYLKSCSFCSMTFYNLLTHHLSACPNLISERATLRNNASLSFGRSSAGIEWCFLGASWHYLYTFSIYIHLIMTFLTYAWETLIIFFVQRS